MENSPADRSPREQRVLGILLNERTGVIYLMNDLIVFS